MLRPFAVIFGLALLIVGILGFIPPLVESGNLFGIFRFNFEDRIAYISSGILGILCGLYSREASKLYFIILGAFYALLALLGFLQGEGMLLGLFANNRADSWFNSLIATLSLYLGFTKK